MQNLNILDGIEDDALFELGSYNEISNDESDSESFRSDSKIA